MYSGEWTIADFDPDLQKALDDESRRQEEHIELIASENYASPRVLEAQGTKLTNKYVSIHESQFLILDGCFECYLLHRQKVDLQTVLQLQKWLIFRHLFL